jgi:hypothetical protein
MYPHRKKSSGVISGERGVHGIVYHGEPNAQENACQDILRKYEPNVGRVQRYEMKLSELEFHIP